LIVEGNIQSGGDKLRVVLTLTDATNSANDGRLVWTQEFQGVPQDLLVLEDQIYGNLATALALKPTNEEQARVGAHPTENVKAYDLYLQGRNALHNGHNKDTYRQAVGLFEQAIDKDANFALAYSGLADSSLLMYNETKESVWAQKATLSAQQAERLSNNLPEVHLSLGGVYAATGKNSQAVAELKRALELAPNSDEVYRNLGGAYSRNGQSDEAIAAFHKAVAANPYNWSNHIDLGNAELGLGHGALALLEFQKVIEIAPDNPMGYEGLGSTLLREGKWGDAIPPYQKALAIAPDSPTYSNIGTAYFWLKNYDQATKMYEKAVEMTPNDEQLLGNLGDAYRWSGHSEQASAAYSKAISLAFQELQVNPRSAGTMGDLGLLYAKKGEAANAAQYTNQARAISPDDVQLMYSEAQVKTLTGTPDDAIKALRRALERGYPAQEAWNDPDLQKLQALPQFSQLMNQYPKNNP
jgi:tetratricopeptide (TPR) repeat protein